ncbi:hypothetical protein ACN47E_001093 [Coniothyrium glycines]
MATHNPVEVYDLLILVDATYSMFNFLESLKTSLPKVIAISNLTNSFSRIGLLAYRDYSEANRNENGLLEWSGWYDQDAKAGEGVTAAALMATASSLEPIGGGDYPEATKTGLACAYTLMREDATTIILLYTDAPPHCWMVADKDRNSNYLAEQAALKVPQSYDGFGPRFADWVDASKFLHAGPRKAHVFCFLDQHLADKPFDAGYYSYLSTVTRGACLSLTRSTPQDIAQVTVDVLLAWMGAEKPGATTSTLPAKLMRYRNGHQIKQIKSEKDPVANLYFWAHATDFKSWQQYDRHVEEYRAKAAMRANLVEIVLDTDVLKKHLVKRRTPVEDFARRYTNDTEYKAVVVLQLQNIIETDVTSMSLNPIFGALWRAVCNDRDNPAREELINAFSLHVDRIANLDEKARMKDWLEGSYDYAAEIFATLDAVDEKHRYPCVYLDPTIEFRKARPKGEKEDEDEDDEDRPITAFRRDELLEIGRSCDGRILRRLGKVLTQLSYAESAADLPAHIAATTDAKVPKIPVSLASKDQGWKFWKILLHVVLPGTMLAARPATVLAALAIRIGLQPLFEAASQMMLFWRDRWNNLEVPETWNASCLSLLLDADAEYRRQKKVMNTNSETEADALLAATDQELFKRLMMYQHTGANLLTTLSAEVAWTPNKTRAPIGPVVICKQCKYPRSITVMAEKSGSWCGLCVAQDWRDAEHKSRAITTGVNKEDNESSIATWVECSTQTCRAQYVCYNPSDLNVRPKCHYCRLQPSLPEGQRSNDPAPTLECTTCWNKIIWPREWRATLTKPFCCPACISGRDTIVTVETDAQQLCKENAHSWLLRNDGSVLKDPFKRTVFHTISSIGPESFLQNVEVFPSSAGDFILAIRGKRIHNQDDMIERLKSWVMRRTAERAHCSLCFSTLTKTRLLPACRRSGCHQQICEGCLQGWYGLNSAGTIINTAALFCPFCRRPPAARTLATYGMGIHAVGDLRHAVEERGQWVHAWCYDCGKAKRLMERECAMGVPDAIEFWKCEECTFTAQEAARIVEEEAQRALAAVEATARETEDEQARFWARQALLRAQKAREELEMPIKECPGCKVQTQKTWGCDHMTCPIKGCKTHWCWRCGEAHSVNRIYKHTTEAHGGLYEADGDDDEQSDLTEYDG